MLNTLRRLSGSTANKLWIVEPEVYLHLAEAEVQQSRFGRHAIEALKYLCLHHAVHSIRVFQQPPQHL